MRTPSIANYLHQLHSSQHEDGYMPLVEADDMVVPQLIHAFHAASALAVRVTLINLIGQHGLPWPVNFFVQALRTDDPQQRQAVLDGLVTLNSAASMQALEAEREQLRAARKPSSTRLVWLDEALEQLTERGTEP